VTRVLILQGHPDASAHQLCHALAEAYADGARTAGHELRVLEIARLDFPLLRSQQAWEKEPVPDGLAAAQQDIAWAQHIVIVFPLWLGDMPALLKAFLEQVARPGFAFGSGERNAFTSKGLRGRSARLVVTMGMPAFVYRWYFAAHGIRSLRRNVLNFVGIAPVKSTLIGGVGQVSPARAQGWFDAMRRLGRAAG
jgi:putative NADPH-quinone reductase